MSYPAFFEDQNIYGLGVASLGVHRVVVVLLHDPPGWERRDDERRGQPDGRGLHRQLTGEAWEFPAAGFSSSGVIHGTPVRCIPIEEQVREHADYELREVDRHDLALLRERLGPGRREPEAR